MIDLALAAHSHTGYASSNHTHDSSEITNLPSGFTSFSNLYALDLTNKNLVIFRYTVIVPKNTSEYGVLAYAIANDNAYTYVRHWYNNTVHQVSTGSETTSRNIGVSLSSYTTSDSSNKTRTLSGVGFVITFGPTYGALCATTYSNLSSGAYYLSTYSIKPYTSETTYLRIYSRSTVIIKAATDTTYGSFSGIYI